VDRRERLALARLYVVTDARTRTGDLPSFLDAALGTDADLIQLREKDADAGDLLRWGERFREAARRHGALFVVNDRPDVALDLGADGVHVGQDDLPPSLARGMVGPDAIVGLSCHTPAQLDARPPDVDYVTAGPVHATPTKPGRAATGLGLVRHAAGEVRDRPWFAIGGLDARTLPEAVEAGAQRIVVVRAVTEAPDPSEAVRSLLAALPPPAAG
jgi:thiamine-phosphate pyrophosphorylase